MASDLEQRAKEAFMDDHFELAVDLYTQAMALNPQNAELYSDRAQANIKAGNLTGTLFYSFNFVNTLFFFFFSCLVPKKARENTRLDFLILFICCGFFLLSEAVADANKAIEFDPSLYKAYFRKGWARMHNTDNP